MDEKELAERVKRFEERMEERRAQGNDQPRETKEPPLVDRRRRIGF